MDNPFSKYFSGQSPISTANYEPQDAEDYLSSGEVLGRPSAKNTAQRGMSVSDQMRDAYKSLMGDEYLKPKDILSRQSAVVGIGKPSRSYLEGIANERMSQERAQESAMAGRGQFSITSAIQSLSDPKFQQGYNLATTRPATKEEMLRHVDQGGRMPLNADEWQKRGLGGFTSAMGSGGVGPGFTQAKQTSTSNVLEYGKEYQMRGEGGKPLYTSSGKPVTTSELTGTQLQEQFKGAFGRYGSEEEVGKFKRGEYESGLQARGYIPPSEIQKGQPQQQSSASAPVMMGGKPLSEILYNMG